MVEFKETRDRNDIYGMPVLGFMFKNQTFLTGLKMAVLALFIYGVYMGFVVPGHENIFTTYLFWGLFWPVFMVITLATFGKIFCGICPHGFVGKYLTKFGLKKEMPKFLRNRYIGILLLFFGWWGIYYFVPGFWRVPLTTAWLFLGLTLIAFVMYYLYKDMSYCKYICPIGTLTRVYGKVSFAELGTYKEDCNSCKTYECASACSYNLKPYAFDNKNSMDDCTLCMDCSSACDSVAFRFTKPSRSLFEKFKFNKSEIWALILITAAITITMNFHHALSRTAIADTFIWSQSAAYVQQYVDFGRFDAVGLFAMFYATVFSIGIVYIGMFVASKILKASFEKTFYTLGYAFVPLFIIGGLAHLIHSIFTHHYADIGNAFIYGFGLDAGPVENLASRRDAWLRVFDVIPYLAAIWAYLILAKRIKFFESSKMKKVLAFVFASSLITFYLSLNLYRVYAFATYGAAKSGHHGSHGNHGAAKEIDTKKPVMKCEAGKCGAAMKKQ
ncbi:4Fe-4S binding protein [Sulfurovum sp. XGS-02]|uniref:4Fe-4S binding protein n=1 Tax=Sulfurovum sp. XGS-02 TaxID=2925411 RepID=UPI0020712D26|nr:4Fe-4S binding protein [Sulfurovum sp. XGS-02]UPT78142.1 4Fe-4S binding protein [Sulfurovum sp. XGS-02]